MRPSARRRRAAWHRSADDLATAGHRFLTALGDLDNALSIRPELRLSTWESAATSHARDPADGPILRDNVRRIISVWSTVERVTLTDYSARLWNGLVGGLYRERWRVWLEELTAARNEGRSPDETELTRRTDAVTDAFISGSAPRPVLSARDALAELRRLLDSCTSVV